MANLYQYDDMVALSTLSINRNVLEDTIPNEVKEKLNQLVDDLESGVFPAFSISSRDEDIVGLHLLVENWKKNFKNLIVIGVGGSSLGAQALVNFKGKFAKNSMDIYFLDNVDPTTVDGLIQNLPLTETVVLSVSKSGSTLETMAQTLLFFEAFKVQGLPVENHIVGLTENKTNTLRNFLESHNIPILNHPEGVGGRFTVLTLVGLIPAIVAGVDAVKIREGALSVLESFLNSPYQSDSFYGALLSVYLSEEKNIQYMMPYSDRLRKFSEWFVQLWAESLGKDGVGTTPVSAVGSTDQHSALQLLMDGPKDKLVTLIVPDSFDEGSQISSELANQVGIEHLKGLNLGKLIYHQAQGTADALTAAGVPVRTFYTQKLTEEVLGALIMHFMLETAVAGVLFDVNTWDQPGVEEGKKRTLEYLMTSHN
ncbi:MAG: glucose-6-phosphate isomerase [Magnetococcales bacterium]|nr:glucose-6-phosphate isomerase [Magnetococcales bacterium]